MAVWFSGITRNWSRLSINLVTSVSTGAWPSAHGQTISLSNQSSRTTQPGHLFVVRPKSISESWRVNTHTTCRLVPWSRMQYC